MSKQTEALKMALEAAEVLETLFKQAEAMHEEVTGGVNVHCQITVADLSKGLYAAAAIREALAEKPAQQEPVAHAVIAGALFDFMGWLTSRKERIVLSSADNASPAVEAITEFAKMRGLSLDDAKVQDWSTSPPASKPWVGLTEQEREKLRWQALEEDVGYTQLIKATEAKLREKNA